MGQFVYRRLDRLEWVVGPKQDVIRLCELKHCGHRVGESGVCDVNVEFPQLGDHPIGDVLVVLRVVRITVLDSAGDHRHGSARMRNDDLDVRILMKHAVGKNAGTASGDIEVKL